MDPKDFEIHHCFPLQFTNYLRYILPTPRSYYKIYTSHFQKLSPPPQRKPRGGVDPVQQ